MYHGLWYLHWSKNMVKPWYSLVLFIRVPLKKKNPEVPWHYHVFSTINIVLQLFLEYNFRSTMEYSQSTMTLLSCFFFFAYVPCYYHNILQSTFNNHANTMVFEYGNH